MLQILYKEVGPFGMGQSNASLDGRTTIKLNDRAI
jgi:hypothetical protein